MDRMTVYASGVAVVLYIGITYIRTINSDSAIIPFFISGIVIGFVAASVKWGFGVSFLAAFVFTLAFGVATTNSSDPNVLMSLVIFTLIPSLIIGVLGAAAGFGGRRVFRRSKASSSLTTPTAQTT